MNYLGVGTGPVNAAGTKTKLIDRKVRLTELILRCSVCAQVKEIFTIQKKAKYTDMKALVLLVVVNGIAAAYSLLQAVRCVVGMMKGTVLINKPLALAIKRLAEFDIMLNFTMRL